jgi:hypothetical protein
MYNIKINTIEKLDNLFITEKTTSNNIIKNKINTFTDNILSNIEDSLDTNNKFIEDFYIGYVKNNKIHGQGILLKKNKVLIEGLFNNNIIENANCNINNINLKGTIENGEFILGTYNYDNIMITGNFKEGYPINNCKFKKDNIVYDGEWRNGNLNGLGIYKDNEIKYEGEWLNNEFNGNGILNTPDYNYEGLFHNGKKHGEGKLIIDNMEYFVEYDNDNELNRLSFNEKKVIDLENNIQNLKNNEIENKNLIEAQENEIMDYNNKLKIITREKKDLEEKFLCKICYKNTPTIVLNPCHHACICDNCEMAVRQSQGRKCPICRKPYKDITRIFMS